MNQKQLLILLFGIIGIILIVSFTPRYKIIWMDSQNFVKTEQTSSLYKRSKGEVKLHWDRILLYSGAAAVACGIFFFLVRDKDGKPNL